MSSHPFPRRPFANWLLPAALVALIASLGFAPVRAWAGQFLGLFRVQQVQVLPLDTARLSSLTGSPAFGEQVTQLLSDSVLVTRRPGEPQSAASAGEAGRLAGFPVRLPANRGDISRLTVHDGAAFQFTVDRARAQALLDEAGFGQPPLPTSLDGATISVDIPPGVTAAYGDCPPAQAEDESDSPDRRVIDCTLLVQIPSPTVETPPDLDVGQLAEIALQLTGMSAAQARAFSQSVDWTSTLVIPIPRDAASYRQVQVDGVTGTLLRRPAGGAPEYLLIWVKDGTVYAISGAGNNTAAALAMANALR